MNEFSLIDKFFKSFPMKRDDVVFGIGDDAACLQIPPDKNLMISTDTLVSGIHFLPDWNAYDIACKAVMVNVSDMAAMAAQPCWMTLALTMPDLNLSWLELFSKGLKDSLSQFNIALIGGDTTHGPLSITLTIMGLVPQGRAVRRCGAKKGDSIFVSGKLGAAALAVKLLSQGNLPEIDRAQLVQQLMHPIPRTDLTPLLCTYASSAIDISDGLSSDLNHLCTASKVGADLIRQAIPVHPLLNKYLEKNEAIDLALNGGDDYELCFTVPPEHIKSFTTELEKSNQVCHLIGTITELMKIRMEVEEDKWCDLQPKGYSHF